MDESILSVNGVTKRCGGLVALRDVSFDVRKGEVVGPGTPADPSSEGSTHRTHIFVAFMAYALHVTLRHRLRNLAPGLTPRAVLEKFGALQMIDVHLPTTDGRTVIMSRYTQPEPELQILLTQLRLSFPNQPPPRMIAKIKSPNSSV